MTDISTDIDHPKHRAQGPALLMGVLAAVVAFGLAVVVSLLHPHKR
jgi:hypothetical protein